MLDRIAQTIASYGLIPDGAPVLAAVSGGADSMLLLHALHRLGASRGWRIAVCHLNHGLRGKAAEDDNAFVGSAVRELGLAFRDARVDIRLQARESGESIEMAGRRMRRDFMARTASDLGIDLVATGHTADDRVETLLLTLARGAGLEALTTIPYRAAFTANITLVRPLLDVERPAIEQWLRQEGIAWREDPSNRNGIYRRNRVRHELLPWLETRINPRVREALRRLIEQAELDNQWTAVLADELTGKCLVEWIPSGKADSRREPMLAFERLLPHPAALRHRVLFRWLERIGVPVPRIDFSLIKRLDAMITTRQPSKLTLAGKRLLVLRGDTLQVNDCKPDNVPPTDQTAWLLPAIRNGSVTVHKLGFTITLACTREGLVKTAGQSPGRMPAEASIRLPGPHDPPLALRYRRPGDRLRPTGSGGTRKIQDILTDARVPRSQRSTIPLLVSGPTVVWLPGYRISEDWRVPDAGGPHLKIRIEPLA